eukprot:m.150259 g.150259  ORF g.150259 m.150259 type:complete len:336 (-) comp14225_c0_seq6:1000-2007(-)
MIVACGGSVLLQLTYLLVVCLDWPLWVLMIGELVYSFSGGASLFLVSLFTSLADVSTPTSRTLRMVLGDGALFAGMVFGLLIGGPISVKYGYAAVFTATTSFASLCTLMSLFSRETLAPQKRAKVSLRHANIGYALYRLLFKYWYIAALSLIFIFQLTIKIGVITSTVLYTKLTFHWEDNKISMFSAALTAFQGLALLAVMPLLRYVLGSRRIQYLEPYLMMASLLSSVGYFVVDTLTTDAHLFFWLTTMGLLTGMSAPLARAFISKLTPESEQVHISLDISSFKNTDQNCTHATICPCTSVKLVAASAFWKAFHLSIIYSKVAFLCSGCSSQLG